MTVSVTSLGGEFLWANRRFEPEWGDIGGQPSIVVKRKLYTDLIDDRELLADLSRLGGLAYEGQATGAAFRNASIEASARYGRLDFADETLERWVTVTLDVFANMQAIEALDLEPATRQGSASFERYLQDMERQWLVQVDRWRHEDPAMHALIARNAVGPWGFLVSWANGASRFSRRELREHLAKMCIQNDLTFGGALRRGSVSLQRGRLVAEMPVAGWAYYLIAAEWMRGNRVRKCPYCSGYFVARRPNSTRGKQVCSPRCRKRKSRAAP